MSKYLKRVVNTIFLMLGNECNFNCKYCLQHPLVTNPLTKKINPDIYEFIKELSEDSPHIRINFYGGEPMLYFKTIKEVIENTKDFASFSMITNGSLITKEHVKFFNENDIPITVSWDGYNVLNTRGQDVLAKNSIQKKILFGIKYFGITAVSSALNYPKEILQAFQDLDTEYYEQNGYHLQINVDQLIDSGCMPEELLKFDFDRIESEMFELANEYIILKDSKNIPENKYVILAYFDRLLGNLYAYLNHPNPGYNRWHAPCSNGYSVLNMDLEGNLYDCHNKSKPIGDIYMNYFKYLNEVMRNDTAPKRYDRCKDCLVLPFCNSGCKLVTDEKLDRYYCRLKEAFFLPFLSVVQNYGVKISEKE